MPPTEAPEPWGGGLWDRLPKQKRRTWLSQLGGFVEGQKGDDEGGGGGGGLHDYVVRLVGYWRAGKPHTPPFRPHVTHVIFFIWHTPIFR